MAASLFLFPSSVTFTGTVGAVSFVPSVQQTYGVANPSTSRTFDVNTVTAAQLGAVVGTLLADLRTIGLVL